MKGLLNKLFIVALILFMMLGMLLVFGQLLSVILLNGAMTVRLETLFFKPACAISATACMLSFVMRYIDKN